MIGVWLNDPISQCIHPGWDVLTGFDKIMVSWQKIFSSGHDLEIKLSHIEGYYLRKTCMGNLSGKPIFYTLQWRSIVESPLDQSI